MSETVSGSPWIEEMELQKKKEKKQKKEKVIEVTGL